MHQAVRQAVKSAEFGFNMYIFKKKPENMYSVSFEFAA